MNVPYEVLTKCCYYVADPSSKMAASGGLLNEIKHVPFLINEVVLSLLAKFYIFLYDFKNPSRIR